MTLQAGSVLADRFKIISPLGSESTPTIYKVFDQQAQKNSAIKVIAGAETTTDRKDELKHKIRQISALSHPNIAHIEQIYEEHGLLFYTLELSEGESVYSRLRNEIARTDCDIWIKQVQSAMQAFHQIGCVMGELRIDKMLIDTNNNIHIMDFATEIPDDKCYEPGTIADLRAPEVQSKNTPSPESDIYSLGAFAFLLASCVNPSEFTKQNKVRTKLIKAASKRLTVSNPEKRPDIHHAVELLSKDAEGLLNLKNLIISLGSIILLSWIAFTYSSSKNTIDSNGLVKAPGITVITTSDLPALSSLASLLYYPLNNYPQFSVRSPHKVSDMIENLALQPLDNKNDLNKLADAFGVNYFVVIQSTQIAEDTYLFTTQLKAINDEESLFEFSKRASSSTLDEDLSELSLSILEKLSSWSGSPMPKDYSLFFESALKVTGKNGTDFSLLTQQLASFPEVFYEASIQALNNQSRTLAKTFLRQAPPSDSSLYWSLKLEQARALVDEYPNKELQILNQIIALYPNKISELRRKAMLLEEMEKPNEAIRVLRKALSIDASNPDLLFDLARYKIEQGLYQEVIDNELSIAQFAYRQRNDLVAESKVKLKLGEAYLKLGQSKTALRFFNEAVDLLSVTEYPLKRAEILKNMGLVYADSSAFESAEKEFMSAINIYQRFNKFSEQIDTWLLLARVQQNSGRADIALLTLTSIYEKLRKDGSGNDYLRLKTALASANYELGNIEAAIVNIDYVMEQFDLLPAEIMAEVYTVEIKTRLLAGDLKRALESLEMFKSTSKNSYIGPSEKLLESKLMFTVGNLNNAISINEEILKNQESLNEEQTAEVFLWQSELCLMIADFLCAESKRVNANKYLRDNMENLRVKEVWLTTAIAKSSGAQKGMSSDLFFEFVDNESLSVAERLKYLIDIQERFNLGFASQYFNKIETLLRPEYVLLNIDYQIYRAVETANFSEVKSLLPKAKRYWRYHYIVEQLRQFGALEASYRVNESLMMQQMTDLQKSNYQRYYQ